MRALVIAALALGACASHDEEPAAEPAVDIEIERAAPVAEASDERPAIATMQTRNYRLEVRMHDQEPMFTVAQVDGRELAHGIDLWQLARDFPELHRQYETAFAGEGIELDARADIDPSACEHCPDE
jgi:hypothetical protein